MLAVIPVLDRPGPGEYKEKRASSRPGVPGLAITSRLLAPARKASLVDQPLATARSSRHHPDAGWNCQRPGSWRDRYDEAKQAELHARAAAGLPALWYQRTKQSDSGPRHKRLSWFNAGVLVRSRNDVLAKLVSDPVDGERARWTAGLSDQDLVVDLQEPTFSFLLLGDTGEGDWSQYAVIPPLLAHAPGTSFLFVCSDVLYPLGDVNDYQVKFYDAYSEYPGPIYAVPGNHDWYDDLQAFMYHFCDRSPDTRAPLEAVNDERRRVRRFVRTAVWRGASAAKAAAQSARNRYRQNHSAQPGPYFVIDSPSLRLVCIDTGISGTLDAKQGAWLHRVSADPRPKILLTGKPIWVDGRCDPCAIKGEHPFASVHEVVEHPEHRYVAVIGGDVHNYQHYPVQLGDRVLHYYVSGGGGAFMHETHNIPDMDELDVPGVAEDDFRCYPLRRHSLSVYSRLLDDRLGGSKRFYISPEQAAAYLSEKVGVQPLPTLPPGDPAPLTVWQRSAARVLSSKGQKHQARSKFHAWLSPFLDWDDPPFYKHFLRIEVSPEQVRLTCHGVTGCGEDEDRPCVEDVTVIPLPGRQGSTAAPLAVPALG